MIHDYCLAVRASLTDDGRSPPSGLWSAKEILAHAQQDTAQHARERYLAKLSPMREKIATLGPLASAYEHYCQITENFAAGLFQCYDVEGLPRTNDELEHCFGVARVHERRAPGRRGAIPGVVVTSKQQIFSVEELRPHDYQRWRDLRQLQQRDETRRQLFRFRKKPGYLSGCR